MCDFVASGSNSEEPMTDDAELLRRYTQDRSDDAFAELVRRHVDLVYSSALRQTWGNHHRAQEVTQMVFVNLARKASALLRHPVLPAWLHRSSHLAALELCRKEGRRQRYENAVAAESAIHEQPRETAEWEEVRPVLDEAINRLDEGDRQAIVLRYFANRPFAEVGKRLKLSENAARMRVERALEKLHALLASRGIRSSASALAVALTGHAITAAPAGVALASASAAMAIGGGTSLAWAAFMTTAKLPLGLTAAILVGGTAFIAYQQQSSTKTAAEIAALSQQNEKIASLIENNQRLKASAEQTRNLISEDAGVPALQAAVREAEGRAVSTNGSGARIRAKRLTKLDAGQAVFDVSKLDKAPVVVGQHTPAYPATMRNAGTEGTATIDFLVGSDGQVYNANAVSSTDPAFADAAVEAVSQWVFKPGQLAGQSVNTHMQVPIVFTISRDSPQPGANTWF
jgi:RNA polymerase sigma factor (sigma-70 family)